MAQAKRASSLCQDNLANDATACNIGNNQDDPSTTSSLHLLNNASTQVIWQPVPTSVARAMQVLYDFLAFFYLFQVF